MIVLLDIGEGWPVWFSCEVKALVPVGSHSTPELARGLLICGANVVLISGTHVGDALGSPIYSGETRSPYSADKETHV